MKEKSEVDILVVGFGAAGACAAFEAMETAEKNGERLNILVLDRFEGGGATSRSGGIIYFGGGTDVQRKLKLEDSPENMFRYLKIETGDAVSDDTLWRFCQTSPECAAWLRDSMKMTINLPDETAVLCPFKTSNAPDHYSVFYSGSETCAPFNKYAKPVPRGHKAMGPGNLVGTGNVLFAEMERAVLQAKKRGITVETNAKVTELLKDDSGRVIGAKVSSMNDAPFWVRAFFFLVYRYGGLTNPVPSLDPSVASVLNSLEARYATTRTVYAKRGVVVSTGGFGRNQELVKDYVPKYLGCMPIGSASDDGYGIFELGIKQAGAKALNLNNASAWKFIVPASSMAKGVLVNGTGARIVNEDVYGARLAEECMVKNGSQGYLVIDQKIWDECRKEIHTGEMLVFQKLFTMVNLNWNRIKGNTLEELAKTLGAPKLPEAIKEYNKHCENKVDTQFGKQPHLLSKLETGPFYAINFDPHACTLWPTPFFTLGGLAVDELTGQVLDKNDKPIPGLFAAGRAASGICSKSYVSGLSLADCVFSGRRAGHFLACNKVFAQNVGTPPAFSKL